LGEREGQRGYGDGSRYLEKYPGGHFKELAEARLGQLKREEKGEER
jgi:hypothetical protein